MFGMTNAQVLSEKQIIVGNDTVSYYDNMVDKTPLFFIHGSFIDKTYWESQLNYFSSKYRVIAIDLPGHGKSTHNRDSYTIREYANDIATIISALKLKEVILVGHSIGADIMLEVNAKIPETIRGLIAIDYFKNAGVQLPDAVINQLLTDLKSNFSNSNEQYARQVLLSGKTDSAITEKVVHDFRSVNPKVGMSMNDDFFHFPKQEAALLTSLDKKLYLINVNYQPTNEDSLSKYVKNYEVKSINGTCHFPMIENPKELNALLDNFIS
jgi:sigma-B regulation protein RsbQ